MDQEIETILNQSYNEFSVRVENFEAETYDPEECEEILSKIRSNTLEIFVESLEELKVLNISERIETLTLRMNKLIHSLTEKNNSKFWYVESRLDEIIDSVLGTYKSNLEKRSENLSVLTPEEFSELVLSLESDSLSQFDHRVSTAKDLPLTEVQISRHQLRKEIQEFAAELEEKFKGDTKEQLRLALAAAEEKAKKIIMEKLNRYCTQFDVVSESNFGAELLAIRKSTLNQIENEMFIENAYNEPLIFKIVAQLEANLHSYGGEYWAESLVYSNGEGEARIRDKMAELREAYYDNLSAKQAHQRRIFIQSEKSALVTSFISSFSFSDNEGEDEYKTRFEQELGQVEDEVAFNSVQGIVLTDETEEEYL